MRGYTSGTGPPTGTSCFTTLTVALNSIELKNDAGWLMSCTIPTFTYLLGPPSSDMTAALMSTSSVMFTLAVDESVAVSPRMGSQAAVPSPPSLNSSLLLVGGSSNEP